MLCIRDHDLGLESRVGSSQLYLVSLMHACLCAIFELCPMIKNGLQEYLQPQMASERGLQLAV